MKKLAATLLILLVTQVVIAHDIWVDGYTRQDGTYVQGHYKTAPDGNPSNNYSAQGNINPYTGRSGTVDPNENRHNPPNLYQKETTPSK
ncbi:MAG: hypothetical protein IT497_03450 [Ottowia sp.]|nr:hypothetical protein [Ottowia sp.]